MHIPFNQIYLGAIGFGATHRLSTTSHLAGFLTASKAQYLSDVRASSHQGERWTIVMGNEAGDLDSIASSVAYAWIQSKVYHNPTIALIQTHHDDLPLRPENLHALSLAGIDDHKSQLLSPTDLSDIIPFPSSKFALVDHNRLGSFYLSPSARVTAVVDHHDDEGLYNDTAHPRIIAPSGSCASHVTALAPDSIPSDLATLLLSAILIDTSGLKPGGKALPIDLRAATILASRSAHGPSPPPEREDMLHQAPEIRNLTMSLLTLKRDVLHLSTRDLLRRDYKEYSHVLPWASNQTLRAGLSSVPLALEVLNRDGEITEAMISWMVHRRIAVLGVSTSYRDPEDFANQGNHKREMIWMVCGAGLEGTDVDELSTRLWRGLEGSERLEARAHEKIWFREIPPWARSRSYQLGNPKASRKVVAPLLRDILTPCS